MIARLSAWLQGIFRREEIDQEIVEELHDHLEREIQMHRERGVPPEEARRLALRDLGGLTQAIEATRAVRETWLDGVWRDVRYAVRVWRRAPRFTATALTLLVLGIGSTTAIFSVAYAVLVRPLPYPDAGRLVFIAEGGNGVAWPNFVDWRARAHSFGGLAASLADAVTVRSGPVPLRLESRSVTSNFFHVLGVLPLQGRLFDQGDAHPDAPATVVVSHAFWMRELGGSPAAIGGAISLGTRPFIVIGVLPQDFRYITAADVYRLVEPQVATNFRGMLSRSTHTGFYAVGRLAPDVTLEAARAEMESIAASLALEYPETNKGSTVSVVSLVERIIGSIAPTVSVIAGAVTLLLLIACVNLAGLILSRSAVRAHEFSIRAAIGGSRRILMRQLLIEQAVLVGLGGIFGALAGAALLRGLLSIAPPDLPRLDEIRLDPMVMSWTTLLSCACALLLGIVPAWKASGVTGQGIVSRPAVGSTRSAASLRRNLMVAEIAVATVLLAGAGLMVHTMLRLARVDPGFGARDLQLLTFSLCCPEWPDVKKAAFYETAVERIRAIPGVENAAIAYSLPILGSNWWSPFTIAGRAYPSGTSRGELPNAGMVPVTAGFFETLRIPVVSGRSFDRTDTPDSEPVAIVSMKLAAQYWPGENPLGKKVRLGGPSDPNGPWRTVVGVVGDVKQHGVDQETPQQMFLPILQQPRTTAFAISRTRGSMATSSMRAAIHDLDRTIPVFNDRSIDQVMRDASSRRRMATIVLSVFGALSVLLSAIGLYGVISQGVAERRREIGVRMALGATRGHVLGLFMRQGIVVAAIGVSCGIAAALAASRSLSTLVFGVSATDAVTLGAVSTFLTLVALLACYLPARAATRVDPFTALRSDA
jgi:putative ABC transport system permease protein